MEPGQRLYEVYQEELDTGCEWGCNTTAATRAAWAAVEAACVPAADAEFKNFHRMLCERFDYAHDERDWKRDQVSLMEWIAKRVEAACASQMPGDVAALVELLEARVAAETGDAPFLTAIPNYMLHRRAASALQAQAAEIERLRDGLKTIRDFPPEGYARRTADGYPMEIMYDEYAYERIVDTYRKFASSVLEANDDQG